MHSQFLRTYFASHRFLGLFINSALCHSCIPEKKTQPRVKGLFGSASSTHPVNPQTESKSKEFSKISCRNPQIPKTQACPWRMTVQLSALVMNLAGRIDYSSTAPPEKDSLVVTTPLFSRLLCNSVRPHPVTLFSPKSRQCISRQ